MALSAKTKSLLLAMSVLSTMSGWAAIAITHSRTAHVVNAAVGEPLKTDTKQTLDIEIMPAAGANHVNPAPGNEVSPQHIRLTLSASEAGAAQAQVDGQAPAIVAVSRSSR